jgi:hypothetical protein
MSNKYQLHQLSLESEPEMQHEVLIHLNPASIFKVVEGL